MKNIVLFLFFMISFQVSANDISDYYYYQVDKAGAVDANYLYIVFLKKDDPCINVKNIKKNTTRRFCETGLDNINLEKDFPSAYATEFKLYASRFYYIVAAAWNEQKCEIYLPKNRLTCEPTGK